MPNDRAHVQRVGRYAGLDRARRVAIGALLEGHSAAAARVASPSLSWLRQLGFVVLREGKGGQELRTGDLRELCDGAT